jgi:hypothetical protein
MAQHCRLSAAAAQTALNAIVDAIDSGGAGSLVVFTGSEPAYADDSESGLTEVATLPFAATAYAAAAADAVNHWADANLTGGTAISDSSATGHANPVTCFRIKNGSGSVILQGTLGTASADINLNSTTISAGASVSVTALEVRVPYNQA